MVSAWRLKRDHVTANGVLMLALGTALFTTEPLLTNPKLEHFGYDLDVILTSLFLLIAVTQLAMLAKHSSRFQLGIYLLFTEFLAACWLLLWVARSVPLDLRFLVVLAGCHGVFWGLWLVKLAHQLRSSRMKATLLAVFAGITSAIGMIIATQPSLTRLTAVTLVSCYLLYIGVSILTLDLVFYRAIEASEVIPPTTKSVPTDRRPMLSTLQPQSVPLGSLSAVISKLNPTR